MITNQTERFSDKVECYIKYRPSYPEGLIALLEREIGLTSAHTIADIGSGTGLSAEPFLKLGCKVFGVEPNAEMREAGERLLSSYPNFVSIRGTAESSTLLPASIDLVIAGQAFHWFDVLESRREFLRFMKPTGVAALVWNERKVGIPFLDAYEHFLRRFGTDYHEVNHIDVPKLKAFFGGAYLQASIDNVQIFDIEGLKGRLLSSSYIPKPNDPAYSPMLQELEAIFNLYEQDGQVKFEMDTMIFWGRIQA